MKVSVVSRLVVLLAASASAEIKKRQGGYADLCSEVRLDDATMNPQYLTGDCGVGDVIGSVYKSRLDLNLCYSPNEDGVIVPTNKGIRLNTSQSYAPCTDCFIGNGYELPKTYYACDCVGPNGGVYKHSGVDLNDLIENEGGFLKCFDNIAERRPF
ncbi:hypothetical protein GGR52DRAFT_558858 [Hypoxylon sp. FL1284]|nr:hypothetical protein GGR52DRAFT_558858 [Hypoxylon sp. FL1284]